MPTLVSNGSPYPRAMYHETLGCVIVDDPGEREALGPGWYETPTVLALALAQAPVVKKGRTHDRP